MPSATSRRARHSTPRRCDLRICCFSGACLPARATGASGGIRAKGQPADRLGHPARPDIGLRVERRDPVAQRAASVGDVRLPGVDGVDAARGERRPSPAPAILGGGHGPAKQLIVEVPGALRSAGRGSPGSHGAGARARGRPGGAGRVGRRQCPPAPRPGGRGARSRARPARAPPPRRA